MACLTRGLIFGVLLLCPPLASADEPASVLEKAPSKWVTLDGHKIHYKSLGEGKAALVFVHCWAGDMRFWKEQVPAFNGKLRVVLLDLPGHGQSDKPQTDYTMDFFAKAVDAVFTDAGVEKAILVGHSMGTPVIRQFYRRHPEKVLGLVVVDGMLRRPQIKPEDMKRFLALFTGPDFNAGVKQALEGMTGQNSPPAVREWIMKVSPCCPQHVGVSAMKNMFEGDIWGDDPIQVPLQVINAKSPHWTEDYVAYVRKLAPQVDYRVMDGVSHYLQLEQPDVFNRHLAEFLKKHDWLKE
jgi:pimeloyl-ACP methyl ester carboxylesterase